jgi:hypothetical protein
MFFADYCRYDCNIGQVRILPQKFVTFTPARPGQAGLFKVQRKYFL